ncbi:MAG: ZIP family metal transporter [Dehalococcoidia bacterium]
MRVSARTLSLALHLATGIVIAVVGLELAPEAFAARPVYLPLVAFVAGAAVFLAIEHVIDTHVAGPAGASGPWSIFGAVSLDLFSDGVMIGTGTLIDPTLGLLLALGQAPADLPEGFAAIAAFKEADGSRMRRLILTAAFGVPIVAGATIGYWGLRDAPALAQASVLALTGGTLLAIVTEEVVPQAHAAPDSRVAAGAVVGGFALFALISVLLGG